jgi:hypothetical protein
MASITQYRGRTWRAIVRRKGFPVQTKTFATKKAAELWAAGIEARMGVSEFDPLQLKQATVTTCATIFERYLAEVVPDMKGRNEKNIVARLIRHAVSRFKGADKQRDKRWSDTDIKTFLAASGHKEDVIPKTGREYVGWALV